MSLQCERPLRAPCQCLLSRCFMSSVRATLGQDTSSPALRPYWALVYSARRLLQGEGRAVPSLRTWEALGVVTQFGVTCAVAVWLGFLLGVWIDGLLGTGIVFSLYPGSRRHDLRQFEHLPASQGLGRRKGAS